MVGEYVRNFSLGKLNVFTSKDAGLRLAMNKSGM